MTDQEKARMVSDLRSKTGASMQDCKKALTELDWSMNLAEVAFETPNFSLEENIKDIKKYMA